MTAPSRIAAISDYYRAHRFQFITLTVAIAITVLWMVMILLRPMPPRILIMATGSEGGAYHEFGKQYQEILALNGIELRLLTTKGGLENLALLKDSNSKVEVAFLHSGTTNTKDSPDLESLGTVCYEPLWFFYRDIYRGKGIEALRGKKISIGPEGSGTRILALKLFSMAGISHQDADLLTLTHREASERLIRGEIDAAMMMTSWDSPVLQRLLTAKGVELASVRRADAYVSLFPYLNKLILPQGAASLAMDRPTSDVVLFAQKASLVVRKDLHPALQYLLLDAAEKIHSRPEIFQKTGEFPAAEPIDLPLSDEASHFYKSGKPFFQRYLPFWLAVLMDRLLILLIPVLGLIYPLAQILPTLYDRAMRRRIYLLYGELKFLEDELNKHHPGHTKDALNAQLDLLERKANRLKVPLSYAESLYTLRNHILLVRELLRSPKDV